VIFDVIALPPITCRLPSRVCQSSFFFFNAPPTAQIYTLSLHDALPISRESQSPTSPFLGRYCVSAKSRLTHGIPPLRNVGGAPIDRKNTRLNSSHVAISYAVFCLKKKKNTRFRVLEVRHVCDRVTYELS